MDIRGSVGLGVLSWPCHEERASGSAGCVLPSAMELAESAEVKCNEMKWAELVR